MNKKREKSIYEGGNAVALTLLGLAVAVLAGVVVLYFIGSSEPVKPMPVTVDKQMIDSDNNVEKKTNQREGWRTYKNDEYNFKLEFPSGWVVATGTLKTGDPVITVSKAVGTGTIPIYSNKDIASHVSVYPLGIASEGINGKIIRSDVITTVPQSFAKDYILKNGKAWATKVGFDIHPSSWNDSGFVFARVVVEEEKVKYLRGNEEIKQQDFDPFAGDFVERSGFVDSKLRATEEEILKSFTFSKEDRKEKKNKSDLINVEKPKEGDIVVSPFVVSGSARGTWYQEGSFPVRLEDEDGSVITETYATALDEWMTDDYVPFEVSVVFEETNATSGRLILMNGNPSGLEENAKKVVIPVLFIVQKQ